MSFVFALIVLFFDVWAVISVLRSPASVAARIGWTIGIVLFPLPGFLGWYFARPRAQEPAA